MWFQFIVAECYLGQSGEEVTEDWKIGYWGALRFVLLLTRCYSSCYIKEGEMGRACGIYGEEEKCTLGFGGEHEGKRLLCEDLG